MQNKNFVEKLKKKDLAEIYQYMLVDFPDNERKPLKMIEESFDTGFMEGYGLYSFEKKLLAYALFVKIDKVLLFDYLAVVPECRGTGVGTDFLRRLQEALQDYDCVIGEVENPDYCKDSKDKDIMQRRINFYLQNGVRDTGATGRVYGVEYRFLEFEGRQNHTPAEAAEIIGRFYHTYWPNNEEYNKYVEMHV